MVNRGNDSLIIILGNGSKVYYQPHEWTCTTEGGRMLCVYTCKRGTRIDGVNAEICIATYNTSCVVGVEIREIRADKAEPCGGWISVRDKLPAPDTAVLILVDTSIVNMVDMGIYEDGKTLVEHSSYYWGGADITNDGNVASGWYERHAITGGYTKLSHHAAVTAWCELPEIKF